jgi:transcriptional regulator with XRE-family HTH domain
VRDEETAERFRTGQDLCQTSRMVVRHTGVVAEYFGAQLAKERKKARLSVSALSRITGIDDGHLGRIERGQRNPTADIARRLDEAFPHREGAFAELYEASRSWVPVQFRQWAEYEDQATRLLVWSPDIIDGLLQTADYARALLSARTSNDEIVTGRLTARMERQQRILRRDDPPHVWFVVDEMALYRRVGSAAVMAGQLRRLVEVSRLDHVTMTVMPAVEHCAHESGFIIGDGAAYAESVASHGVHTGQKVSELLAWFGSLQAESYRAADSVAAIEEVGAVWASGVSPLTQAAAAASASKSSRPRS